MSPEIEYRQFDEVEKNREKERALLQLDIVIEDPHLLAGLEGRETDVGAPVAAEGVAEGAVAAGAYFSLDGEVDFGEVVRAELDGGGRGGEGFVGGGAGGVVFGCEALC